jgi:UDP-GlcNAc:undecaprenyl-phosphate GlcNAc-1-phosphate transferase
MYLAFLAVLLALAALGAVRSYTAAALLVCGGALTLVGFVDDVWGLGPGVKLRFQAATALVAVAAFDIAIRAVTLPGLGTVHLEDSLAGYGLTLFWFLGMINTVNFADGIDGLAGGLAFVFAVVLLVVGLRLEQADLTLYAAALGGSTLGFLRYNFAPARIFMGDSGSMFLGFTMGALSVLGNFKLATGLLVMGLPIADVAYTILRRWRSGAPVQMFDKGHLHHRFLTLGLSQRRTALIFYALALGFGSAALIPQREGRLVALLALGAVSLALIWWVSHRLGRLERSQEGPPRTP